MEINEPQITTESLIDRIREGARRRTRASSDADDGVPSSISASAARRAENSPAPAATETGQLALQPDFEPRSDNQYHARDLLQYHDRNFIQNAYRAILKRGPDATGYTSFIEGLRSGRLNKIDVLARLRYSTEGRAKKVQVSGLFLPAAIRQLYRVPLVGYLLRFGVALLRLPAMVRNQQQFEAHMHAQLQQVVDHTNHISKHFSEQQHRQAEILRQEQQQSVLAVQEAMQRQFDALKAVQRQFDELKAMQQQLDVMLEKAVARWQREMQLLEARYREENAQTFERVEQLTQSARAEAESLAQALRAEVERLFQKEQEVRTELTLQRQRVARLLEEAGSHPTASLDARQLETLADEEKHLHDAFYFSFEESFRGSPAEIKERLKVYLPFVEQARIASGERALLDIGCGRGEWLELLRETDVSASGVDSNRVLVEKGRARGLSITESDLLDYLRSLPDESLGALTGFHIVEHLPLEMLLRLLDETVRALAPGGLVIFETPNPENVLVGSCNFYFDPTHRNPLPAPVMKFLLESRGLQRVEIIRLNPSDAEPVLGDTDLVKRFNQYFYGPMDYAVVGWKTKESSVVISP